MSEINNLNLVTLVKEITYKVLSASHIITILDT